MADRPYWTMLDRPCILGFVAGPVAITPELKRYNERQLLEVLDPEPDLDDGVIVDLTEAEPVVVINTARRATPPPPDPSDADDTITRLIRIAVAKALDEA